MKAVLTSLVFAVGVLAQSFTINTPTNAVVCQPLLLNWSGGTPPYFLSILPGNEPSGTALVDLGQQSGTSVTWVVNQAQGTSLGLTLRDSNGAVAQSAPFTVNGGPDTSCVGKNPSSSGGASAPATTGGATSPTTAGATTTPGTTPATTPGTTPGTTPATTPAGTTPPGTTARPATASTTSRSTAASSAGASTTSNAASANLASIGSAGVIGAALAALLV